MGRTLLGALFLGDSMTLTLALTRLLAILCLKRRGSKQQQILVSWGHMRSERVGSIRSRPEQEQHICINIKKNVLIVLVIKLTGAPTTKTSRIPNTPYNLYDSLYT